MTVDSTTFSPETTIAGSRPFPRDLQQIIDQLSEPFPITELRIRPGPVRRDGSAAQVLPYAEWWRSYQPRLDMVLGRANWSVQLIPWGSDNIIARMSVFEGLITRDSTGSSKEAFEGGQDAEAQAMKRVCARTVGLGLFLYFMPEVWGKGERDGKRFYFADGEEERCLYELYRRAGINPTPSNGISRTSINTPLQAQSMKQASHPSTDGAPTPAPLAQRLHTARSVLLHAEQQVGVRNGTSIPKSPNNTASVQRVANTATATERQRAAIVRLIAQVGRDGNKLAALNLVGQEQAQITELAAVTQVTALPRTLSSQQASALITALQGLLA